MLETPGRGGSKIVLRYTFDIDRSVTGRPGTYLVSFDNCYSRKHPVRLVVTPVPERIEQYACQCADRAYNPIAGSYWTDGNRKVFDLPADADPNQWSFVTAGAFGGPISCTAYLSTNGGGCNCAGGYGYSSTHTVVDARGQCRCAWAVPGGVKGYSGTASACVCVPPRDGSYVCPP